MVNCFPKRQPEKSKTFGELDRKYRFGLADLPKNYLSHDPVPLMCQKSSGCFLHLLRTLRWQRMNCYSYEATRSEARQHANFDLSQDVRTLNPSETAVSEMTGIEMKL
jgi:hypothetical protein